MKYLSVCSGIEAASVAWHQLGWKPLAFSEIEPFPRAVLAHHYADVPCHGDFTKLRDEAWIVNADVLVGGTPCQAFSVAGLRNSLADDRGNLSLEFVRLADAIDDFRHDAGKPGAIIVWENVPGVLSVKDNAFGCFLAALAGEDSPLIPTGGRWTDFGVVIGPRRRIAWRVLDAQYFGLAQRRRRVFVVASSRDGCDPVQILSQPDGVQRHSPPRRETRERIAPSVTSGAPFSRTGNDRVEAAAIVAGRRSHWDGDYPHPSLTQSHNTGGVGQSNQELFSQRGAYPAPAWPAEIAPTLNAAFGEKQGLEDQHIRGGQDCLSPQLSMCLNAGGMGRCDAESETLIPTIGCVFDEVAHTLKAEGFDASEDGTGRGTPLVPVQAFYSTESRCDHFPPPGLSPPLKVGSNGGGQPPAIAFSAKDHGADASEELSPTLRAMPHDGSHANGGGQMAVAVSLRGREGGGTAELGDEVQNCLRASSGGGDKPHVLAPAFPLDLRNAGRDPDKHDEQNRQGVGVGADGDPMHTLSTAFVPGVVTAMAVRRLTPVECERLQGFPDGYTMIPWRGKPAEECPDGPRYKALGNSMAVPVMRWIGQRIVSELEIAAKTNSEEKAA